MRGSAVDSFEPSAALGVGSGRVGLGVMCSPKIENQAKTRTPRAVPPHEDIPQVLNGISLPGPLPQPAR